MAINKHNTFCRYLLTAYMLSIGFQTLFDWPVVGEKVQLPELLFLCLAGYLVFFQRRSWFDFIKSKFRTSLVRAVAWYAAAFLGTNLVVGQPSCWLEWMGLLYLATVFLTVWWIGQSPNFFDWIVGAFSQMGAVAAAAALVLWAGSDWLPFSDGLGINTMYYPAIGVVRRATGFTPTPNMLFSILAGSLIVRILVVHWQGRAGSKAYWLTGVVGAGAAATCSKQWLLLVLAGLFMASLMLERPFLRRCAQGCAFLGLCFFLLFSHISVLKKDTPPVVLERLAYEFQLLVPEPVGGFGGYAVYWNGYALWKKTAVLAGFESFPFGIGAGRHCTFIENLRAAGRYPANFPCNDPHCTYTGAFGELGALGFVALLWLGWQLMAMVRRLLRLAGHNRQWRGMALALATLLLYFALEASVVDVLNFRHLWVAIGVLAALEDRYKWQEEGGKW